MDEAEKSTDVEAGIQVTGSCADQRAGRPTTNSYNQPAIFDAKQHVNPHADHVADSNPHRLADFNAGHLAVQLAPAGTLTRGQLGRPGVRSQTSSRRKGGRLPHLAIQRSSWRKSRFTLPRPTRAPTCMPHADSIDNEIVDFHAGYTPRLL